MKKLLFLAGLVLVFPNVASAKELQSISICGASGCTALSHEQSAPFIALFERMDSSTATKAVLGAVPVGPYYKLGFKIKGDTKHTFSFSMWFVRPNLIRQQGEPDTFPEPFLRVTDSFARELDGVARRLVPYPAPRVMEATVNGKRVSQPARYIGLFAQVPSVEARADDTGSGAWVNISLVPDRANPWFKRGVEFMYRTKSQALFVNEPLRVPDRLADHIAADAGLPVPDRRSAWQKPVEMSLAAGAFVLAATIVFAFRRRRRAES